MDIISTIFPFLQRKRRQEQDQQQLQQNQQQIQVQSQQQLLLLPIQQQTYYSYPYPNQVPYNISVPYQYNSYLSSTSYGPQPQQKRAKLQVVVPESLFSKSEQRQVVVPESLFSSSPQQQQLFPSINNANRSNNYYNDDVIFNDGGGGDEWEIESHQVVTVNDINLDEYIKVVKSKSNNGTTYVTLQIATDILNKGEKPYRAVWYPAGRDGKRMNAFDVYSQDLWQTDILKHLHNESTLYEQWSKSPRGKAKNNALEPFLEAMRTQMINHPIIGANIKAVIIQSLSNTIADDRCSVDNSLAEHLIVVQRSKNQVSLHIATDGGELSVAMQSIVFKQTKGWKVTIIVPSNASDQWKIIQPLLSALKSKLLDGIDLDREGGLTTVERTEILQRAQHYILTSKEMSRAVQDVVDNTEGQATPTSDDIYLRPPNRLDGGDLARVQNEATVSFYEVCNSEVAEIEMQFEIFADSVAGKDIRDVMRDAATAIVSGLTCNFYVFSKSRKWRQISSEFAIHKATMIMMNKEFNRRYLARVKEELAKRVIMLGEYRGRSQINGLPLIDTTMPEDVNRLLSIAGGVVSENPNIKYWYAGLGNMNSKFELSGDEGIQSALRTLFCKPTGKGLSATDVGPTPDYLCQAEVFVLAATVGSARGRLGEIPLIEYVIDSESRTDITCINQGVHGGDTGVKGINLLFVTGYRNLGERLRNNEMNLCLHGCRRTAVARWDASIPPAEQNYIEWDPRIRHERESTTEAGKIRVTYKLNR